jgi:predicted lipoprotein with Yx(FWY)xxD motif
MRGRSEHVRWLAAPVLVVGAVAVLAACGSNSPSSSPPSSPSSPAAPASNPSSSSAAGMVTIKTASTGIGTVLVNAQGHTLYWFALDTPTKSNCTGTCATYWSPVIGTASASGMPHGFGTITRSNGQKQVTYDGHPLYTYVGDTSAGMTSGNAKNLSGGYWWAMTPTGAKPSSAKPKASSSSSSSGGYGY